MSAAKWKAGNTQTGGGGYTSAIVRFPASQHKLFPTSRTEIQTLSEPLVSWVAPKCRDGFSGKVRGAFSCFWWVIGVLDQTTPLGERLE